MGALKQGMAPTGPAPVHKKRPGDFDHKRDGTYLIYPVMSNVFSALIRIPNKRVANPKFVKYHIFQLFNVCQREIDIKL